MIKTILLFLAIYTATACAVFAQKGTAESGYWPMGYAGDTWTGEVTGAKEDTREMTLTYIDGKKVQTFTGVLPAGYTVKMKDGTIHAVKMDELIGFRVKIYYINKTVKDADGTKRKVPEIFLMKF